MTAGGGRCLKLLDRATRPANHSVGCLDRSRLLHFLHSPAAPPCDLFSRNTWASTLPLSTFSQKLSDFELYRPVGNSLLTRSLSSLQDTVQGKRHMAKINLDGVVLAYHIDHSPLARKLFCLIFLHHGHVLTKSPHSSIQAQLASDDGVDGALQSGHGKRQRPTLRKQWGHKLCKF